METTHTEETKHRCVVISPNNQADICNLTSMAIKLISGGSIPRDPCRKSLCDDIEAFAEVPKLWDDRPNVVASRLLDYLGFCIPSTLTGIVIISISSKEGLSRAEAELIEAVAREIATKNSCEGGIAASRLDRAIYSWRCGWDPPEGWHWCDALGCKNEGMKRCTRCGMAYYCSQECQRNAWQRHKEGCTIVGETTMAKKT